jgi:endonuclease/exonuclease/phosphatase family metal-dependent hydrolase
VDNAIQKIIAEKYAEACSEHAHENFTPVFYKKDRFEELDGGFVPFDGLNDINSKSITWGLFEDKNDGKRLAVVSTHFWWKATGEVDDLQRIDNAKKVKEICDSIIERYGEIPVIVSGDFNSSMTRPGYIAMVENGFTDARFVAKNSTKCPTLHAYPILNDEGIYVPDGGAPYVTIDFVFTYGKKPVVTEFSVLADDRARTTSDHCPVVAKFDI